MPERQIKIRGFTYTEKVQDPGDPNREIAVSKFAVRDEVVNLSSADVERGERLGAFYTDGEESVEEQLDGRAIVDLSDDEIDEWFSEKSPTVQEVLDASDGDPESAQRLLAAEERATGGSPRSTLVEGLGTIIARQ